MHQILFLLALRCIINGPFKANGLIMKSLGCDGAALCMFNEGYNLPYLIRIRYSLEGMVKKVSKRVNVRERKRESFYSIVRL